MSRYSGFSGVLDNYQGIVSLTLEFYQKQKQNQVIRAETRGDITLIMNGGPPMVEVKKGISGV